MIPAPQHPSDPAQHRTRISLAVISGVLAGIARALTGWLLDYLTAGN